MLNTTDSVLTDILHEFGGDDTIQPIKQIRETMTWNGEGEVCP